MKIDGISVNEELIRTVISYVVPTVLAVIISFVKPLADFVWREVVRTWRSLVIAGVFVISFLVAPRYCVWIALATFVGLSLDRLHDFKTGEQLGGKADVLFAGFYCLATSNGKVRRSGNSELLDVRFLKNLSHLISDHKIQEFVPVKVKSVKLPAILYTRDSYESFEQRMRGYAKANLGVIWGIVDEAGRVIDFEITVNEQLYWGREAVNKLLRDIRRVFEVEGLSTAESIDFVSMVLAALWGQSFCSMLNHHFGKWQASLQLASQSRVLIEQAISNLSQHAGEKAKAIAQFERRKLVPMCLFEEATALGSNEDERALNKLHEALLLDPLWPLDNEHEFTEFYNNRYAWELSHEEPLFERLAAEQPKYATRGLVRLPPILQVFVDWIGTAANVAKVRDLNGRVFEWFDSLARAHPQNPYIFIFWADAIRTLSRAKDAAKGKTGSFLDGYVPPLKTLDRMIEKLQQAYQIRPDLPIVSSRLAVLYFMSSVHFKLGSAEHRKRLSLMARHGRIGGRFFDEFLPEDESD